MICRNGFLQNMREASPPARPARILATSRRAQNPLLLRNDRPLLPPTARARWSASRWIPRDPRRCRARRNVCGRCGTQSATRRCTLQSRCTPATRRRRGSRRTGLVLLRVELKPRRTYPPRPRCPFAQRALRVDCRAWGLMGNGRRLDFHLACGRDEHDLDSWTMCRLG